MRDNRNLNPAQFPPEQLQMLMTATELKSTINHSYDARGPLDDMWAAKLKGSKRRGFSHGAGVYQSIKKHGWDSSLDAGLDVTHKAIPGAIPEWDKDQKTVSDGHHRIAAAADLEERGHGQYYIPVQHWDNRYYE